MDSIPLSAVELGLNFKDYEELARNVGRMANIPLSGRIRILERAEKILLPNKNYEKLIMDIAYDPKVFKIAGIEYYKGPPKGEKLFISALVDFLMRRNLENTP